MEKIIKDVDSALRAEFPGAVTELELVNGKVWGYVLWDDFLDVSAVDRVTRVGAALRHYLGKNYRTKVLGIFPHTPLEISIMREELAMPQNH